MNKTLLILALITSALFASPKEWIKVNVIVASKSGLSTDKELQYSYNDAQKLHYTLSELSAVEPRNNFIIKTESPDKLRLELYQIQEHITSLKKKSKVLLQFYYSGHGSGSNFHIGNQKIPFKEVKSILKAKSIDTRIFILDVCFGGTFLKSKGFSKAKPIAINLDLENATKGEVIISSSAVNEQAYEVKTLEGSVFSTNWIMGLRGAGDKNGDGHVSLFEVYNHAYDHTVNYTSQTLHKAQHPSYNMDLTGAHDIVLTSPSLSSNGIVMVNCPIGVYTIYNKNNQHTIGDLRISQKGNFFLALPPGEYSITTANDNDRIIEQHASVTSSLLYVDYSDFTYKKTEEIDHESKGSEEYQIKMPLGKRIIHNSGLFVYRGFGYHSSNNFEKSINTPRQLEEHFDMSGNYIADQSILQQYGFGAHITPSGNWGLLTLIEFYTLRYSLNGTGQEQTQIPTPSLTVDFEGTYNLFHLSFGLGLTKRVLHQGSSTIDCDATITSVTQTMDYDWTMERNSFENDIQTSTFSNRSSGFKYAIGATYRYNLPIGLTFALGSRISAYFISLQNSYVIEEYTIRYNENTLGGALDFIFFIGGGDSL